MNQVPSFVAWQNAVVEATSNMLVSIALFLPNLVGAILLFILGYVLSNWLKKITTQIFAGLNLTQMFKNTSVQKFLKKAELSTKVENVLGETVKLLTLLIFFVASVNLLGLTTVTLILNNILAYIPNVFAAVLVLAIGTIIAGLVERLVKGSLGTVDVTTSRLLAKLSSYTIIIFTVLATLSQLRIAASFVNTLFTGFVAMLALGLGLSLGLGSKDLVKKLLEDWYQDFRDQTS